MSTNRRTHRRPPPTDAGVPVPERSGPEVAAGPRHLRSAPKKTGTTMPPTRQSFTTSVRRQLAIRFVLPQRRMLPAKAGCPIKHVTCGMQPERSILIKRKKTAVIFSPAHLRAIEILGSCRSLLTGRSEGNASNLGLTDLGPADQEIHLICFLPNSCVPSCRQMRLPRSRIAK
ncbi:MAG: hypothetical protein JWN70_5401 [Planctomycetaceae bacterium]|nr:hypothetical protein [Planctomycetaceae bacterium]